MARKLCTTNDDDMKESSSGGETEESAKVTPVHVRDERGEGEYDHRVDVCSLLMSEYLNGPDPGRGWAFFRTREKKRKTKLSPDDYTLFRSVGKYYDDDDEEEEERPR